MYRLYLGKDAKDMDVFPITPSSMEFSAPGRNQKVDLVSGGELPILKEPGLTEISFEVQLPNVEGFGEYPGGFLPAEYYIVKINQYREKKQPLYFVVQRMENGLEDSALWVYVEELTQKEDVAGVGLDTLVQIKLKAYRERATPTLQIKQTKAGAVVSFPSAKKRVTAKEVLSKVKPNTASSLAQLVKKEMGSTQHLEAVMKLNKITDPTHVVSAGEEIKLGR